ncbi:acyltransferase family protein [Serratia sp. IR-2025]
MRYIKELEGLRGCMALWVVLGHALAALPLISHKIPPAILNSYAVDVFIILSGFVIFFMINNKKQSYGVYLTQRFFRIFPVYIFALTASILLINFSQNVLINSPESPSTAHRLELIDAFMQQPVWHSLAHYSLLQGLVPDSVLQDAPYTIIGQAWSVSVEWQFYLIAPLLFILISGMQEKKNLVALVAIFVILIAGGFILSGGYLGNNLLAFCIGFISFFYYRDVQPGLSKGKSRAIFVATSIIAVLMLKKDAIPIVIWLIAFNVAISKHQYFSDSIFTRILDSRPILFLGRISYSVYMVHMIVLYFVLYEANQLGIEGWLSYIVVPGATVIISVVLSYMTYTLIEKPFIALGKRLTASKERQASPALT